MNICFPANWSIKILNPFFVLIYFSQIIANVCADLLRDKLFIVICVNQRIIQRTSARNKMIGMNADIQISYYPIFHECIKE